MFATIGNIEKRDLIPLLLDIPTTSYLTIGSSSCLTWYRPTSLFVIEDWVGALSGKIKSISTDGLSSLKLRGSMYSRRRKKNPNRQNQRQIETWRIRAIAIAVKQVKQQQRYTKLKERLENNLVYQLILLSKH